MLNARSEFHSDERRGFFATFFFRTWDALTKIEIDEAAKRLTLIASIHGQFLGGFNVSTTKPVAAVAKIPSTNVTATGGWAQFAVLPDAWGSELAAKSSVVAPTEYWQQQISEAVIGYQRCSKNELSGMLDAARCLLKGVMAARQIEMRKQAFFELAGIKPTYAYRLLVTLRMYEKVNDEQQAFLGTLAVSAITELLWAPEETLQLVLDVVNRDGGRATAKLIRRIADEVRESQKPAGLISEIDSAFPR